MRGVRRASEPLELVLEEENGDNGDSMHSSTVASSGYENSIPPIAPFPDAEAMTESSSEPDEYDHEDSDSQYMSLGQQFGARSKQRRQEQRMRELLEQQKAQMQALVQSHNGRGRAPSAGEPMRHTISHDPGMPGNLNAIMNSARPSLVMGSVLQSMPRLDIGGGVRRVTFEGWMLKKGQHVRNWKRRFFNLTGQELKYSESPGGKSKGFGLVLGVTRHLSLPRGLSISLAPNRTLEVQAESTDDQEAWLLHLNQACGKASMDATVTPIPLAPASSPHPSTVIDEVTPPQPVSGSGLQTRRHSSHSNQSSTNYDDSYVVDTQTVCEGWLYKQGQMVRTWKKRWFSLVNEVLSYREMQSSVQVKGYGRVMSVQRSMTTHAFGLVIELDNNRKLNVYAEDADTQKRWHRALAQVLQPKESSAPSLPTSAQTLFKQSKTHGSFIKNFSGWMNIPSGPLNMSWKRCFFTLHGVELAQSDDTPSPVTRVDTVAKVTPWSGKSGGLEFAMTSGRVWKVMCPSIRAANAWIAAVEDCQGRTRYTVDRFLKSCDTKQMQTIVCGWLTRTISKKSVMRQYFVLRHLTLSIASDVDETPEEYDVITGMTPAEKDCALEFQFVSSPKMVVECDTVDALRHWHRIVRTCLNETQRGTYK
ncbi:hypothetical protein Ae201684P_006302 [Aphanomyces euteiches]|uniref:PH domain-containing protein n=1 Tax=Aphanomyces euteiches TaxID=100861 RepID=A0A6G0XB49_9STRA|nr:hypothetical protein Ae201684_006551 [Aphanomyces euteiches]KAH9090898.1 hypothetical protein Ae201684P_006302 [Aphanomyces euteiches]KAH9157587.1 hypothetical protein AeRB84_000586 [Aphanomyces euteiches]